MAPFLRVSALFKDGSKNGSRTKAPFLRVSLTRICEINERLSPEVIVNASRNLALEIELSPASNQLS